MKSSTEIRKKTFNQSIHFPQFLLHGPPRVPWEMLLLLLPLPLPLVIFPPLVYREGKTIRAHSAIIYAYHTSALGADDDESSHVNVSEESVPSLYAKMKKGSSAA
jgi:hypothetical protein